MTGVRLGLLVSSALVALLILAGCGDEPGSDNSTIQDASSPSAPDAPGTASGSGDGGGRGGEAAGDGEEPEEVPEVLEFDAEEVSGEPFDPRSLAGTDTVFWFWAPWCTECAAAAPEVQEAAEANPGVGFVGVAGLSSDSAAIQDFVDRYGLGFTQLADLEGSVYTHFGITQQDTFVLVSADGDVETVDGYASDLDPQQLVADAFG